MLVYPKGWEMGLDTKGSTNWRGWMSNRHRQGSSSYGYANRRLYDTALQTLAYSRIWVRRGSCFYTRHRWKFYIFRVALGYSLVG